MKEQKKVQHKIFFLQTSKETPILWIGSYAKEQNQFKWNSFAC